MYAIRGPDIDQLQRYARDLMARMRAARRLRRPVRLVRDRQAGDRARDRPRARRRPRRAGAADRAHDLGAARRHQGDDLRGEAASATTCASRCGPSTATIRRSSTWCACARRAARWSRCATWSTPRIGSGPVQIDRESRTRAITVYGNLDDKAAGTADDGGRALRPRSSASAASTSSRPVGPTRAPARDHRRDRLRLRRWR